MKIGISILEDQPAEAEHLKSNLYQWSSQTNYELEISEYRSGEDFFKQNDRTTYHSFSVFFLDIQMHEMSGLDVAKKLRKEGYQGPIIFLTAFREYVFHGYEVHAMNYLLKPVKQETLFLCLDEIAKDLSGNSYLYRNKQDIIRIPYRDILSFSSSLHYVDILTVSEHFCQYATLNNIIEYLPQEFIRTHKSCIVNMAHIYKISGSTIVLSNHMTTQIGRSYLKSVASAFTAYSTRFDGRR
ncbi:MAG: LytTR family DNA-binding domain-containing protein [Lachnospiraceae bacterium]|nr:LytTR family DNA-binding domain-containing protein [Lachnospiraceae bacterium]